MIIFSVIDIQTFDQYGIKPSNIYVFQAHIMTDFTKYGFGELINDFCLDKRNADDDRKGKQ